MAEDSALKDHQAWIGYLQPDGLVVSASALVDSGVVIDRARLAEHQQAFVGFTHEIDIEDKSARALIDLPDFLIRFLEWRREYLAGIDGVAIPDELSLPLPEFGETLSSTFALKNPKPADGEQPWLILLKQLPDGADLDAAHSGADERWSASASRRFERLLRETRVSIGIISNGISLRLIYAPSHGENSGSLTFPIGAMCEVAGRPILGALHLLLRGYRLYAAPSGERLSTLLRKSREYQSSVSTELAGQVLDALYELLRGFQAANDKAHGELLKELTATAPDQIYVGLLTVLLRLVFLLYAEDRDVMPRTSLYVQNYSVHGMFEKLRADFERYPDTIDQRYGAWARLLALFRAVYAGSKHPQLEMTPRKGFLFDPERYPFLEGRAGKLQGLPLLADGVIFRVLRNLLILKGERLSYRTLDVEQIGSVYERMMGFKIELTEGTTVALKPAKTHGAPTAVNLAALLAQKPSERAKWLAENSDQKLNPKTAEEVKRAGAIDELLVALENRIARNATPHPVPKRAIVLQPSDERRRSSSHYTPRSFTAPIVERALKPILDDLGEHPTPAQILELKICDPAVGSGAFLVEACRQVGEQLVKAWHHHNQVPYIPPDEDEILLARRIVAQRCLYGVDKNPIAVDLAKLSLWLATLAREHPFTFLDHNLKCGDSLVGLTRRQLGDFHWRDEPRRVLGQDQLEKRIQLATARRKEILEADDELVSPESKREKLDAADEALEPVRQAGACVIAAFFSSEKDKERFAKRDEMLRIYSDFPKTSQELDSVLLGLASSPHPIRPFHWEIEYPEVFDRANRGFDLVIGNPPFMGGMRISSALSREYLYWLYTTHPETGNRADLVSYFFRQGFLIVRFGGTLGLVGTNTIAQGDSRPASLTWIIRNGGDIFYGVRRQPWPGEASVVVSVIVILKGRIAQQHVLDGRQVTTITSYLLGVGTSEEPQPLLANRQQAFIGCNILGMGFTFADNDPRATPLEIMRGLVAEDPRNVEVIHPFIGGRETNESPNQEPERWVIDFEERSESEAAQWPELYEIVKDRVRPERQHKREHYEKYWWRFGESSKAARKLIAKATSVLTIAELSRSAAFVFQPPDRIFAHTLIVFPSISMAGFCILQSRIHQEWALFIGSKFKDDLRYSPSDCFETFPFPSQYESIQTLGENGQHYHDFRQQLMNKLNEGLTKIYNRFHDPAESSADILELRELHRNMDQAVLDAYGWSDLKSDCKFLLDYEEEKDDESNIRKKPWRYRWPDDIRDQALARLLALNAQRAEQERLTGLTAETKSNPRRTPRAKPLAPGQTSF